MDTPQETFRWFGVAVFTAVLIFGATMSVVRTAAASKLQAVAVALTPEAGGAELTGLYVASAADRVYLADVQHCKRDDNKLRPENHGHDGRIIEIPRASIRALSIGKLELLTQAKARGPVLLADLRKKVAPSATVTPAAAATDPCASEGILDTTLRADTPVPRAIAARLARRFRPILRFDSGEAWRPLRIETLMAERDARGGPRHRVCLLAPDGGQRGCEALGGVVDISGTAAQRRVIDFAGERFGGQEFRSPQLQRCPGYRPGDVLRDCDSGPASAIYYHVTNANGRYYVDYWWFLRYNRFAHPSAGNLCKEPLARAIIGCFDHEGDWEGVTVVTAPGDRTKLASVGYAAHHGVYRHAASELELHDERPAVFVAQGSHASYSGRCPSSCSQPAKKYGQELPEMNTDGARSWGRNGDAECFDATPSCLQPLPAGSWNAFDGRWGSRECTPKSCRLKLGPETPSRQRRYKVPWCALGPGQLLVCDGHYDVREPKVTPRPSPPAPPPATRAAP